MYKTEHIQSLNRLLVLVTLLSILDESKKKNRIEINSFMEWDFIIS